MTKKWKIYETDEEKVKEICEKYQMNPLLATILVNRNITEEAELKKFLKPTRKDFHDPFLMPDMNIAVERIIKAIAVKEFNNKENNTNKIVERETIYKETDAPIVYEESKPKENGLTMPTIPQVAEMQSMKAQSKGNVNNNVSRSQVINIESNNPAVVTATMREADYEMNNADRAIAMASQGAGW